MQIKKKSGFIRHYVEEPALAYYQQLAAESRVSRQNVPPMHPGGKKYGTWKILIDLDSGNIRLLRAVCHVRIPSVSQMASLMTKTSSSLSLFTTSSWSTNMFKLSTI